MKTIKERKRLVLILVAFAILLSVCLFASKQLSPQPAEITSSDFMEVIATNGKRGYVEIEAYNFATHEDTLARRPTEGEKVLPVYNDDGETIGLFVVGNADQDSGDVKK